MHTGPSPQSDSKKPDESPRSQNLIKDASSEICKFTDLEIKNLKSCFPSTAIFRPFDPSVQSDGMSEVRVCFPALPFLLRFSYPFPALTQNFFKHTGISYSRAMPMLWRTKFTGEQVIEEKGLQFGLSELAYLYALTTHGSNRFVFKSRPRQPVPILKTT